VDENTQNLRKSTPTFIVAPQPEALWTNGDDGRIQRIKKVLKYPGPFHKVLIVGERGGRIKPRRKFSISEIGGLLSPQKLTHTHTPTTPSAASVALYLALLRHQN